MNGAGKPNTDSSVVNFGQADNLGTNVNITALDAAASGDSRLQTALVTQGILGKRPMPANEAKAKLVCRDINSEAHEHLAKYSSAQEPNFVQSKRRRLNTITDTCPDKVQGNVACSSANRSMIAGALDSTTELRANQQAKDASLTLEQAAN